MAEIWEGWLGEELAANKGALIASKNFSSESYHKHKLGIADESWRALVFYWLLTLRGHRSREPGTMSSKTPTKFKKTPKFCTYQPHREPLLIHVRVINIHKCDVSLMITVVTEYTFATDLLLPTLSYALVNTIVDIHITITTDAHIHFTQSQ